VWESNPARLLKTNKFFIFNSNRTSKIHRISLVGHTYGTLALLVSSRRLYDKPKNKNSPPSSPDMIKEIIPVFHLLRRVRKYAS
jgi:hypothetical protein